MLLCTSLQPQTSTIVTFRVNSTKNDNEFIAETSLTLLPLTAVTPNYSEDVTRDNKDIMIFGLL